MELVLKFLLLIIERRVLLNTTCKLSESIENAIIYTFIPITTLRK